ncbi:hypothetical protein [Frigidibacter sp. ROC022]|uniref:hypothetical protein n=1 Tax=Frigidibacter sp. ROC022 TaxID=2971796 RepID=UPI00215AEC88|nr:hypothetical protein [Frigidibacter sp. ROC022]MCR8723219.1 hypothetical protein [Frigidibacter sp. ROC022]
MIRQALSAVSAASGGRQMRLGVTAAVGIAAAQGALAEEKADCIAAGKTMSKVAEMLDEAGESRSVSRMAMVRTLSSAGLAAAYAADLGWPEDMAAALLALRDLPKPRDDGSLVPGEDAYALVVENALILAAGMPGQCPETEIPDFTPYAD